jgi:hypothetical protein
VSFISLDRCWARRDDLARGADIVALVKPQFEAGKGRTDRGVVRDPAIHREVLETSSRPRPRLGLGARDVIAVADPRARRATASSSLHLARARLRRIRERIDAVTAA